MMNRIRTGSLLLALFGAAMLNTGCGGDTFEVTGRVVRPDGAPLTAGQIELQAVDGSLSSVGFIADDGTFELGTFDDCDGTPAGDYRVVLRPPPPGRGIPGEHEADARTNEVRSAWLAAVPAVYQSFDTSNLMVTVDTTSNYLEIVLESHP